MIRQATYNDLEGISFVHTVCFPESYITQLSYLKFLGGNLLPLFYKEFLDKNPELFIVAENDDKKIVGFCMGYYLDNDVQINNFMKRNWFIIGLKTLVLLLICNKYTWKKIISRVKHKPVISDWIIVNKKYEYILKEERGDLLSICVLPEYRGKGYAQNLIDSYLLSLKSHGRKLCLLSVNADNKRARNYYEKNGFELYRTRGINGITYIKLL